MGRLAQDLAAYAALIRAWAPRLDLVSDADLPHLEDRHIQDSLRLLEVARAAPPGPAADVGSGAGLPGVPLALATRGHRLWRLIEPRKKRAAFLEEVVRELDLDAEVIPATAEDVMRTHGGVHALATARALATPDKAIRLLEPLLAPGGYGALLQGRELPAPDGTELWEPGIALLRAPGE